MEPPPAPKPQDRKHHIDAHGLNYDMRRAPAETGGLPGFLPFCNCFPGPSRPGARTMPGGRFGLSGGGGGGRGGGGGDDERRRRRLEQLRAMSQEELDAQIRRMRGARELPNLPYHFEQHKDEFGAATEEEYAELFGRHVEREDLKYFTFLRPRGEQKMWYLVAEDSGHVAQYNESRQRPWSFFRPSDLGAFLREGAGRWIEVDRTEGAWRPTEE